MTTYAAFVSALAGLTVTGVKRALTSPPNRVSTADMPLSYPRLPMGTEGGLTAEGQGGWPAHTAELVIVMEPVGQNLQDTNFGATVAMVDSLSAALRSTSLAKSKNQWTIRQEAGDFGGTNYWLVVATVSASG